MRILSFLFFVVFHSSVLLAQPFSPSSNDLYIKRIQTWYNAKQFDSLYYNYADEIKSKITIDDTQKTFTRLYEQLGKLQSYELISSTNGLQTYKGNFEKVTLSILLATDHLAKIKGIRFVPYNGNSNASNFKLPLKEVTIYGELLKPRQSTDLVILVAGSGPTDRDGNSSMGIKTDAYKKIAEYLQNKGIASLRYDKRGVGGSTISTDKVASLTLDDYVRDLVELIGHVKKDTSIKRVFIAGHSEGALIGLLAAKQLPVDGYISMAGAGESIDKIIMKQLNPEREESRERQIKRILEDIKAGKNPVVEDTALKSVFSDNLNAYWKSWMRYNPTELISSLKIPVLVLHGDNDMQVATSQAELLHAANPASKLVVIKKMNHVLKTTEYDKLANMAAYQNPSLPVAAELLNAIDEFLSSSK